MIFPTFCCACQRSGAFLCPDCINDLSFFTPPISLPLKPLYLDKVIAAVEYQSPISQLIQTMKYQSVQDVCQFCARFLYDTTVFPQTDFITAVPMARWQQWYRGFNQAEEIAKKLAQLTHVPYQAFLEKTRSTRKQARIRNREKRLGNLTNIFQIKKDTHSLLTQKSILLIDDVATTGTTLNECARILKSAGAEKVIGLVLAHGG